jgi:hypothetical protein
MKRRLFFRALIGASAPAAAVAMPAAAKPVVMARAKMPACECGFQFVREKLFTDDDCAEGKRAGLFGGRTMIHQDGIPADNPTPTYEYMYCDNRRCRHFGVPFALPRIALEPADPEAVRRIAEAKAEARTLEERQRRDWLHAKEWLRGKGYMCPRELELMITKPQVAIRTPGRGSYSGVSLNGLDPLRTPGPGGFSGVIRPKCSGT